MLALRGLDSAAVRVLAARHGVEIAIVNDVDRIVVGGEGDAIAACEADARERGAKRTRLPIRIASHTSRMRPAVAPFRTALESVAWKRPLAPVMAGTSGAPIFAPARAREALAGQLATTIEWSACMEGLRERGCAVLLELGPGAALARMARERFPDLPARSVAKFHSLNGAANWVVAALAG
jgi:[acyl-carrier-protein] S-malonyltransferase